MSVFASLVSPFTASFCVGKRRHKEDIYLIPYLCFLKKIFFKRVHFKPCACILLLALFFPHLLKNCLHFLVRYRTTVFHNGVGVSFAWDTPCKRYMPHLSLLEKQGWVPIYVSESLVLSQHTSQSFNALLNYVQNANRTAEHVVVWWSVIKQLPNLH